jgi:hypothetical protein
MNQTLTPPPEAKPRRRSKLAFSSDSEKRAIQIGVLGTVFLHLLVLILAPYLLKLDAGRNPKTPEPTPFTIEYAPPDEEAKKAEAEKTPPPNKFVEANPDAPDNVPDKTNNFSFMNQQVAQEKPTPNGKNDMPALEGQKDIQSTQIVTGELIKPQEAVPMTPPAETAPQEEKQATPKLEQIPLAGFEKKIGDEANSVGTNIAKFDNGATTAPEKVEGQKDAPLNQSEATVNVPKVDRNNPQPRPVLAKQNVRPGIFSDNKVGTMNIGPTAVDARWSNYGVYLQRMIETVQIQWDRILIQSSLYPPSGTKVTVTFRMDSEGTITKILDVKNSSSEQGKESCVSAIIARSPYGKWSDDMVAMLGTSQEMTFTFFYQ